MPLSLIFQVSEALGQVPQLIQALGGPGGIITALVLMAAMPALAIVTIVVLLLKFFREQLQAERSERSNTEGKLIAQLEKDTEATSKLANSVAELAGAVSGVEEGQREHAKKLGDITRTLDQFKPPNGRQS